MEYNIDSVLWYGSEDEEEPDYCGKGCRWRIEGDTLIIGGSGEFVWVRRTKSEYKRITPSESRGMSYNKVIIEEGISSIAREAGMSRILCKLQNGNIIQRFFVGEQAPACSP